MTPEESGGYSVSFPQLPEAITQGDDMADAIEQAAEVLELVIAAYLDDGIRLPDPVYSGHFEGLQHVAISVEVTQETIERVKCVTASEAARMLGLSKGRITHMLGAGILQAVPFGNDRLVTLASINARINNPKKAGRPPKKLVSV